MEGTAATHQSTWCRAEVLARVQPGVATNKEEGEEVLGRVNTADVPHRKCRDANFKLLLLCQATSLIKISPLSCLLSAQRFEVRLLTSRLSGPLPWPKQRSFCKPHSPAHGRNGVLKSLCLSAHLPKQQSGSSSFWLHLRPPSIPH